MTDIPLNRSPVSIWFRIAGIFGAAFCLTAVAWAAAGVGDQNHPLKLWLGRHGGTLIGITAGMVVVTTILGMVFPEPRGPAGSSQDELAVDDRDESRDAIDV